MWISASSGFFGFTGCTIFSTVAGSVTVGFSSDFFSLSFSGVLLISSPSPEACIGRIFPKMMNARSRTVKGPSHYTAEKLYRKRDGDDGSSEQNCDKLMQN